MQHRLFYLFIIILAAASNQALAASPPGIKIQSVSAFGSGCPVGTWNASISPDAQTFSLLLDNFIAESSMQKPVAQRSCALKVSFQVPIGWTFAVTAADYRGFAYSELGTLVTHQSHFSFDGSNPKDSRAGYRKGSTYNFPKREFVGPYYDNYFIHNEVDLSQAPWATCNSHKIQTLYVFTKLMAKNLNPSSLLTAQITLDSIDGQIHSQKYRLAWKPCRPGKSEDAGKKERPEFNRPEKSKDKNKKSSEDPSQGRGRPKTPRTPKFRQ